MKISVCESEGVILVIHFLADDEALFNKAYDEGKISMKNIGSLELSSKPRSQLLGRKPWFKQPCRISVHTRTHTRTHGKQTRTDLHAYIAMNVHTLSYVLSNSKYINPDPS